MRAVVRSADCVAGPPNEPEFHRVRVGTADLLVARMPDGEVVAFSAECPHQATPLEGATFWEGKLRCARHLYLYDLATGENVLPTRESSPEALRRLKPGFLPVHRAEERDGWVWVEETPQPAPPCFDPAAERVMPPTSTAVLDPTEQPTQTVDVRVGEEFELVLGTTPRPAHMWRSAVPASVAVVSEGFAPDQPPRHIARLVARAPGDVEVTFTYGRPWDAEPAETRTFSVRVAPGQQG